jgi:hypothetical protein
VPREALPTESLTPVLRNARMRRSSRPLRTPLVLLTIGTLTLGAATGIAGCGHGGAPAQAGGATAPGGSDEEGVSRSGSAPVSHGVGVKPIDSRNLSIGTTAAHNHWVVACMHKDGMTVLGTGEVTTPRPVTVAEVRTAERMCRVKFGRSATTKADADAGTQTGEEKIQASVRRVAKVARCLRRNGVAVSLTEASSALLSSRIRTRDRHLKTVTEDCRDEVLGGGAR